MTSAAATPSLPGPDSLLVRTLPGVWKPHTDAWLLADVVVERGLAEQARVLDMFTGSGVLAISAAKAGALAVTAVDVSRRALLTTRLNARWNSACVRTRRGDMFCAVGDETFDLIVANPPYIPGPHELPARGIARAWEGGFDGRRLIDRLCAEAVRHLSPGGRLLFVQSSMNGEARTLELLRAHGLSGEVLLRRRGRLGAVSMARVNVLRERGLLEHPDDDREETLIILATRPGRGDERAG